MRPVSRFLNLNANDGDATVMWQENFQGVALANTVIQFVPEVEMNDEALRRRLISETENELNGPANAYSFINKVRERAGLPPLSGRDPSSFRQALRKERATELGFEGHRKYDLLRCGIFVKTIRNVNDPHMETPATNIQDYNVLMPVPAREIEISEGSLSQNLGY